LTGLCSALFCAALFFFFRYLLLFLSFFLIPGIASLYFWILTVDSTLVNRTRFPLPLHRSDQGQGQGHSGPSSQDILTAKDMARNGKVLTSRVSIMYYRAVLLVYPFPYRGDTYVSYGFYGIKHMVG
jgi:hypothetical protein